MLSARHIKKSYGSRTVLEDVSLNIQPGQITCLIGPSGSGKTTLLRQMAMLEAADGGEITIDGTTVHYPLPPGQRMPAPWPHVTVVFQSLFLWPHLTLRDNIMLPARNRGVDEATLNRELEELTDFFEMGAFINNYPNQASLGQRQRVAVARALMLNPHYILMDEITSALDIEQVHKILSRLSALKKKGIGLFLITHQIGFARQAADQVVFMDDGLVVEQGTPDILQNPQTQRLKDFLSLTKLVD